MDSPVHQNNSTLKDKVLGFEYVLDTKASQSKLFNLSPGLISLIPDEDLTEDNQCIRQFNAKDISSTSNILELFEHLTSLASIPGELIMDKKEKSPVITSRFEKRVSKHLDQLVSLQISCEKEKEKNEQQTILAKKISKASLLTKSLPLSEPTRMCLSLGWDVLLFLLRDSRKSSPVAYVAALNQIRDQLKDLQPLAYSDTTQLASSAILALNNLCEFLSTSLADNSGETSINGQTVGALADLAVARGSAAHLLISIAHILRAPSNAVFELSSCLSKLESIREQPLYGKQDTSGELYVCGQNSYGELGLGDDIERHLLTRVSLRGWDIVQVASGNETLAIVTSSGALLTCGLNKSGQCGHGHYEERVMMPCRVKALNLMKVKSIAAANGCEHMIAVLENGTVYSWGYNDRGQLGHGNTTIKINTPRVIEAMKGIKVISAAVSYHHSILVTETGKIYTCGMNDCGQLGLEIAQHQLLPQIVKALDAHHVIAASCGLYHTVVCTNAGEVYSFGKNDYGQLGAGHNRQLKVPVCVVLSNEVVSWVSCGYYHTILVTVSGKVYSCGRNDYGQLGVGNKVHQNTPQHITIPSIAKAISSVCGCYHTILLMDQGDVFAFGRNNKGQLGNRSFTDSLIPMPFLLRPGAGIKRSATQIAAGFYTSAVVLDRQNEESQTSYLKTLCGRADIDRSGEIEGLSNFASIAAAGVSLYGGRWYYEVEVVTSGLIQIGWTDFYFQGSSDQGEGVGDHIHSWSYDGNRQRRWNSGSLTYGERWKTGDIIGCFLNLDTGEMSFSRNGNDLGIACTDIKPKLDDIKTFLMPAISLEKGEIVRVNFGSRIFQYPQSSYEAVHQAYRNPSRKAYLSKLDATDPDRLSEQPPQLTSTVAVLVGDSIYLVGGEVSTQLAEKIPCSDLWIYNTRMCQWKSGPCMPSTLRNHAVVNVNNQLIVIGGESTTSSSSRHMDIYRYTIDSAPDASAWEIVSSNTDSIIPQGRAFHCAGIISVKLDVSAVIYGGKSATDEYLGDCWLLSLSDFSWSKLPSAHTLDPGARINASLGVIGESVYIFGGEDSEGRISSDLWKYSIFEREWQLCHDEHYPIDAAASDKLVRQPIAKSKNFLLTDSGNIWIYGGKSDLWVYSTLHESWSSVTIIPNSSNIDIGTAVIILGTQACDTFLPQYFDSSCRSLDTNDSIVSVHHNSISIGGLYLISLCNEASSESFKRDKLEVFALSTMQDSATVNQGELSTENCIAASTILKQIPSNESITCHRSAISMLAHLDRLAGGHYPLQSKDTATLSRCSYRFLCINAQYATFKALYNLLEQLSRQLFSSEDESLDDLNVLERFYPILSCLRLLKLNLYELVRSRLDPIEIGFSSEETASGGILQKLRDLLFRIADYTPTLVKEGYKKSNFINRSQFCLYCNWIRSEAVTAVHSGFSVLFPSLSTRIHFLTQLLRRNPTIAPNSAEAILLPLILPSFNGPAMLFSLLSELESKETLQLQNINEALGNSSSFDCLIEFTEDLLRTLWGETLKCFADIPRFDEVSIRLAQKNIDNLESSVSFCCLNVIHRASLFKVISYKTTNSGQPKLTLKLTHLLLQMGINFIHFMQDQLRESTSKNIERLDVVYYSLLELFRVSPIGKLLPLSLLSISAIPTTSYEYTTSIDNLWSQIEIFLKALHDMKEAIKNVVLLSLDKRKQKKESSSFSSKYKDSLLTISKPLADLLFQGVNSEKEFTIKEFSKRLWLYLRYNVCEANIFPLGKTLDGMSWYRVYLDQSLQTVLRENSLVLGSKSASLILSDEYDGDHISFERSSLVLTAQILSSRSALVQNSDTNISIPKEMSCSEFIEEARLTTVWLEDLQMTAAWIGGHFAKYLINGDIQTKEEAALERWVSSPLFKGGLDETLLATPQVNLPPPAPSDSKISKGGSDSKLLDIQLPRRDSIDRNNTILEQIVENKAYGAELIEKVRLAVDPDALNAANPNMPRSRLRRQDSMERTLERSGGHAAVDHAVRATFAVLLKHSNASYVSDPLNPDGSPTEAVVDTWRVALQLRRWIIREQQKLATSTRDMALEPSTVNLNAAEDVNNAESKRLRQLAQYEFVCKPIIHRAKLLLKLFPFPMPCSGPSSPLKLLPGMSIRKSSPKKDSLIARDSAAISSEAAADSVRQLKKLMRTKSMAMIEEEDERIQADIFAYLEQPYDRNNLQDDTMEKVLEQHRSRALTRIRGLQTFKKLFDLTSGVRSAKRNLLPLLASSFIVDSSQAGEKLQKRKIHFLHQLHIAGITLSKKISDEFFSLVKSLLEPSIKLLNKDMKLADEETDDYIYDTLLILDVCGMPYMSSDWNNTQEIGLVSLLSNLLSWKTWKPLLTADLHSDTKQLQNQEESYPCKLPIPTDGISHLPIIFSSCLKVDASNATINLENRVCELKSNTSMQKGGYAALGINLFSGCWYWEVEKRYLGQYPLHVGIATDKLNVNDLDSQGFFGISTGLCLQAKLKWKCENPLGILLDCEARTLQYYFNNKRVAVVSFRKLDRNQSIFPSLGIADSKVRWNFNARIPPSIYHARFNISRVPDDRNYNVVLSHSVTSLPFCWDGKEKSRNIHLSSNSNIITVLEGEKFASVRTSQSLAQGQLYLEVKILALTNGVKSSIYIGVVGKEIQAWNLSIKDSIKLDTGYSSYSHGSTLGVLFDIEKGIITAYQDGCHPVIHEIDPSLGLPLYPAFSCSEGGCVIHTTFYPDPCKDFVPLPLSAPLVRAFTNDKRVGKRIDMKLISPTAATDAEGQLQNFLLDDEELFSVFTAEQSFLVLRHKLDTPFCLLYLELRHPMIARAHSGVIPLRDFLIFACSEIPSSEELSFYDDLTLEEFVSLPTPPSNSCSDRDQLLPIMYFSLRGSHNQVCKSLKVPITARYLVIKLLNIKHGTNVEISFMGFYGCFDESQGPGYSSHVHSEYFCTDCNVRPINGVRYNSHEDKAQSLCMKCYDNDRKDISTPYFAFVKENSTQPVLCATRQKWNAAIQQNLHGMPTASVDRLTNSKNPSCSAAVENTQGEFNSSELYSCGQNNYGELCLGHANTINKVEHVEAFSLKDIIFISGGNEVLVAVAGDGSVYTCGLNKSGQCGQGNYDERILLPQKVCAIQGIPIKMVAAANGCEHIIAISREGATYSWGYNDRGQLGHGNMITKCHTPKIIETLQGKKAISAGVSYHHSAITMENGELWTFGMNDCGQLGLDHTQHEQVPQQVTALSSKHVIRVACGLYHTVALTREGELFSFGKNDYGQLGLSHTQNVKVPELITGGFQAGDHPVDICCGYYHTIVCCTNGKVLSCGRNDYGQLGIGNKINQNIYQYVPLPSCTKIIAIASGCYHTLLLSEQGRVLAFGRNNKGQLGAGSRALASAELPVQISTTLLEGSEVVAIGAGFYSTYILTGTRTGKSISASSSEFKEDNPLLTPKKTMEINRKLVYEEIIKEIDRRRLQNSMLAKLTPVKCSKLSSTQLELLMLRAAAWTLTRVLLFQMLGEPSTCGTENSEVHMTAKSLITAFLENLDDACKDQDDQDIPSIYKAKYFSLEDSPVGLFKFCAKESLPTKDCDEITQKECLTAAKSLYCNQILSVLLRCGTLSSSVCRMISSHPSILRHLFRGIFANQVPSATIGLRFSTLVFPLHSVSSITKSLMAFNPTSKFDIITLLLSLIGNPLTLWPSNDGYTIPIVQEGITAGRMDCIYGKRGEICHSYYIALTKSAEAVCALRYLLMAPHWKAAINASLSRLLLKSSQLPNLLDIIAKHNASFSLKSKPQKRRKKIEYNNNPQTENSILQYPEEHDFDSSSASSSLNLSIRIRDENYSYQKSQNALEEVSLLIAAICVIGGHTEALHEGGYVIVNNGKHLRQPRQVIKKFKKTRKGMDAVVEQDDTFGAGKIVCDVFDIADLHNVERVPALPIMCDSSQEALSLIAKLVSLSELKTPTDDLKGLRLLSDEQTKQLRYQIQWRAAKAIATMLKQSTNTSIDGSLIGATLLEHVTALIISENSGTSVRGSIAQVPSMHNVHDLIKQWHRIKQRQVQLAAEDALDAAVEKLEDSVRSDVFDKFNKQGILIWDSSSLNNHQKKEKNNRKKTQQQDSTIESQHVEDPQRHRVHNFLWGILRPLPQATDQDFSFPSIDSTSSFELRIPVVRVGRTAGLCDLVINDRSVSGKHFQIKRSIDTTTNMEKIELEDFSKNGTIIDGIRVHNSTTTINNGSRISLILSRGGLMTYEFQVTTMLNPSSTTTSSSLVTHQQQERSAASVGLRVDTNITQQDLSYFETIRSPAEIQNRGNIDTRRTSSNLAVSRGINPPPRVDAQWHRLAPSGLSSPNPAVDSPRLSTTPRVVSNRSPGTPMFGSPPTSPSNELTSRPLLNGSDGRSFSTIDASSSRDLQANKLIRQEIMQHMEDSFGMISELSIPSDTLKLNQLTSTEKEAVDRIFYEITTVHSLHVLLEWCADAYVTCQGNEQQACQWLQDNISIFQTRAISSRCAAASLRVARMIGTNPDEINRSFMTGNNCIQKALELAINPQSKDTSAESLASTSGNELRDPERLSVDQIAISNEAISEAPYYPIYRKNNGVTEEQLNPLTFPSYRLLRNSAARQSSSQRSLGSKDSKSQQSLSSDVNGSDTIEHEWTIWTDPVDDTLSSMDWYELEREEELICEALKSVYARQVLLETLRISPMEELITPKEKEMYLHGGCLRRLVFFGEQNTDKSIVLKDEDIDRISRMRQIHARVISQLVTTGMEETRLNNMRVLDTLSMLTMELDDDPTVGNCSGNHLLKKFLSALSKDVTTKRLDGSVMDISSKSQNDQRRICEALLVEILGHIVSILHCTPSIDKQNPEKDICYPKGPLLLTSGLEIFLVSSYTKLWSIPPANIRQDLRRTWRKINKKDSGNTASEQQTWLWRPCLPPDLQLSNCDQWYSLGDVAIPGIDLPTFPTMLVLDDGSGIVAPPSGFQLITLTSDADDFFFHDKKNEGVLALPTKQLNLWWPIAPPGYVAMGCVANSDESNERPPSIDCVRCLRNDVVVSVAPTGCLYQSSFKVMETSLESHSSSNGQNQNGETIEVYEQRSLWAIQSEFCFTIYIWNLSLESSLKAPLNCHTVLLSEGDKLLCSPVTVKMILQLVNVVLDVTESKHALTNYLLRKELAFSFFCLVKNELEINPHGNNSVEMLNCMTRLIRRGCVWENKHGILFCCTKTLDLLKRQDGHTMLSPTLQALIELLLAYQERNDYLKVDLLKKYSVKQGVLPYTIERQNDTLPDNIETGPEVTIERFSDKKKVIVHHLADQRIDDEDAVEGTRLGSLRFQSQSTIISLPGLPSSLTNIIYYEILINDIHMSADDMGITLGFSTSGFPLDSICVGALKHSYGFTLSTGHISACREENSKVLIWPWIYSAQSLIAGDSFGCGLRLDTKEIFFTRNGLLIGTAFSSVPFTNQLMPTISVDCSCSLTLILGGPNCDFDFFSVDWDDTLQGIKWFEALREVYGIVQALGSKRGSLGSELPSGFLLAADGFISNVSIDECKQVESDHPYTNKVEEGLIHIPLATSIRIKLAPDCETLPSHCLQIIRGSGSETTTSSNELRLFTGICGGQEVVVPGNKFKWRFPLQSNFQCRIDRSRCGPYIFLDGGDTRISLTKDKGWQTALGVARFDGGVHAWEVRIISVTSSANIFLGVAKRDIRLDSYIGKDNRGWGWIGNRALWHNGSKQRGVYGDKFKSGDVIRLQLDFRRGTLTYSLNGKDLGVAFGPGGIGVKLVPPLYPAFALYNQRDSVELIGGHRVEDSAEIPAVENFEADLSFISEDEDDLSNEEINDLRVDRACELGALGFPMDWCILALKNCDDDTTRAADYILNNIGNMEFLVKEDADMLSQRVRIRQARSIAMQNTNTTREVNLQDQNLSNTNLGPNIESTHTIYDKWGISFQAIPEYSYAGRRLLAVSYQTELQKIQKSQQKFTLEQDEAIVSIVENYCSLQPPGSINADPLRLPLSFIQPTKEDLNNFSILADVSLEQIQLRFLVLRNFNSRLQIALPFINFASSNKVSILATGIQELRGIIFSNVKLNWWQHILREQACSASTRPDIEIDRHRASIGIVSSNPLFDTVFFQCFSQLHHINPSLLCGAERAFKCQFVGEFGDDFGGLYRECLTEACTELQSAKLPLFSPCPNALHEVGENREYYIPRVSIRSDSKQVEMMEFVGKLMGMAIRTKTPLGLNLPPIICKLLVSQQVMRHDIESINHGCFQVVDTIQNIKQHGVTSGMFDDLIDATFTVYACDGSEVEIVPGGRHVKVTWDDKEEFADAVEHYRLHEFDNVCSDIARGLATILPAATLSLFTWKELRLLAFGRQTIDLDLLKKSTIYGDGCSPNDRQVRFFWEAMESFTDEQKSQFIRFVWGRSRLPAHVSDFTQDFKISGMPKAASNPNSYLPIAHTCFFSIDLPPYTSLEVTRERLLYAITNCQAIDADNTTVAQRAGQAATAIRSDADGSALESGTHRI